MKKLSQLTEGLDGVDMLAGDTEINSVECDSRKVTGGLFAALSGANADGRDYIDDAIKNGAAVILASEKIKNIPTIVSENPRKTFAEIAERFYDQPSQKVKLIGITGTNGKTTVAYLLRHILKSCGKKCGMLGTIEYDLCGSTSESTLTTPESNEFSRCLAQIAEAGEYAICEVSSHALGQYRVWPHEFCAAVFTNLTRDHLDYHADMNDYMKAKQILFSNLSKNASAIINYDDPACTDMHKYCASSVYKFGVNEEFDLSYKIVEETLSGLSLRIHANGEAYNVNTKLVGRFNAENIAAAFMTALSIGLDGKEIANAVATFEGVPGRLQKFVKDNGATVFVDYAHTPDALEKALAVLRPLTEGRLITVFGCGGDRDHGKRPLMASAAEKYSDLVYVTSDNPRMEDPICIIEEVLQGFKHAQAVVQDRREAIFAALQDAGKQDVVLVAGKGHEDYQIVGTKKIHMDDRRIVCEALGLEFALGDKQQCA